TPQGRNGYQLPPPAHPFSQHGINLSKSPQHRNVLHRPLFRLPFRGSDQIGPEVFRSKPED
ncbi:hypothetical protein ABTO20_19635, partial [Acinetobacter baumannii]